MGNIHTVTMPGVEMNFGMERVELAHEVAHPTIIHMF